MLTNFQINILKAKICPYCGSGTMIITETDIYGKEYKGRPIYACERWPLCDSYVSSWEDNTPCGRLSNKELRSWKNSAHKYFDRLFIDGLITREQAYDDLSIFLRIPPELTHIGMFQTDTLKKVIWWSIKRHIDLRVKRKMEMTMLKAKNKVIQILNNN